MLLAEPVGTGTEYFLKLRTGTEEFWNRPSSTKKAQNFEDDKQL